MALDIYVNNEKLDLNPEAVIALTKQVADLKKLNVIKSEFTNTITIPVTDTNKRILESAEVVVSNTEIPYTRIPCRVVQDGVELISYGFGILEEAGSAYKLVVYSGNVDWTTALGNLRLQDLDFTDALHIWEEASILNAHNSPNAVYCYPPIVADLLDPSAVNFLNSYTPPDKFNVAFLRPYVYLSEIVRRIFDEIGYTITGDLLSDPRYLGAVVECSRFEWSKKWYDNRYIKNLTTKTAQRAQTGLGVRYGYLRFEDETNDTTALAGLANRLFTQQTSPVLLEPYTEASLFAGPSINGLKPGRYRMSLTLNLNVLGSVNVAGTFFPASSVQYVVESTVPLVMVQGYTNNFTNNTTKTIEFDVELDPLLPTPRFWIRSTAPNPLAVIDNFTFNLLPGSELRVIQWFGSSTFTYGDVVNPAYNLPDLTQLDFVKAVGIMFGKVIIGDSIDQTVKFESWNNIETEKAVALDWSTRLNTNVTPTVAPRLEGWARQNEFKYTPDAEGFVPEGYGDSEIMVSDQWLPDSRVVYQLPFSATVTQGDGWPFVLRSLTDYDPADKTVHFDREGPPRILLTRQNAGTFYVALPTLGLPSFTAVSPFTEGYFFSIGATSLPWASDLLPDYYGFVDLYITKPKLVTAELLLTPSDIQAFDPFTPVYINKLAAYFFVNKINNWVKGKPCKVELIRL